MLTPGEFREISPPLISVAETSVVKLFRKKDDGANGIVPCCKPAHNVGKEGD